MLLSKENLADISELKEDLSHIYSKASCINTAKLIKKQILSFHVDKNIKDDLLNYYSGFTSYDSGNKKGHISNAKVMISKLANVYFDDLLGFKKEDNYL